MARGNFVTTRVNSVEVTELTFPRRLACQGRHKGHQRYVITVPPEVSRFLEPDWVVLVTLRRAGTLVR